MAINQAEVNRLLVSGLLNSPTTNLSGVLSNATLRGASPQFRVNGTILQLKYNDEDGESWVDLFDLQFINSYSDLSNKPTINGKEINGEVSANFITPSDVLSNFEIENLLK